MAGKAPAGHRPALLWLRLRRAGLYRRFLTCHLPPASNVLPITNRRYGRLKICATLNTCPMEERRHVLWSCPSPRSSPHSCVAGRGGKARSKEFAQAARIREIRVPSIRVDSCSFVLLSIKVSSCWANFLTTDGHGWTRILSPLSVFIRVHPWLIHFGCGSAAQC